MAYQSMWFTTNIPKEIVEIIDHDASNNFDHHVNESSLMGNVIDKSKRNSKNSWIPTSHWIAGFLWHYVERANRENFLYDLTHIDGESLQYTQYSEGEFYGWHTDSSIAVHHKPQGFVGERTELINDYLIKKTENIRKLSFVLQLSDPDDYEGGNLQLLREDGKPYFAPRARGTIILFDSRTPHRVLKVTKGVRKSIVGWTCGPRWR